MAKGPRKVLLAFETPSRTHYGGVFLLHRCSTRIGFSNAVATVIRLTQRNNRYGVGELLLAMLYPMILGLGRIETTRLLQHNGVFHYLTGLIDYPDPSTLRDDSGYVWRLKPCPDCAVSAVASLPRWPSTPRFPRV